MSFINNLKLLPLIKEGWHGLIIPGLVLDLSIPLQHFTADGLKSDFFFSRRATKQRILKSEHRLVSQIRASKVFYWTADTGWFQPFRPKLLERSDKKRKRNGIVVSLCWLQELVWN